MLMLLLSWLYIGGMSLIVGLSGLRFASVVLKVEHKTARISPDYPILLGFVLITMMLAYASLLSPMGWQVHVLLIMATGFLAWFVRSDLKEWWMLLREGWSAGSVPFRIGAVLLLFIAMHAIIINNNFIDTRLYHSQAIQWIREFAVVPGLGNLHGRFAFNSHYFLSAGLFSSLYSSVQMLYPLFSFFFLVVVLRLLYTMDVAVREHSWQKFSIYGVLLFVFAYQTVQRLSSTSTDDITCILVFYTFFLFLDYRFQPQRELHLFILWAIVFTAVTFKLSSVFIVAIIPFTFRFLNTRRLIVATSLAAAILLPFVVRNIILSGYLVYPYPGLDLLAVEWKIPMEAVVFEKELVEAWAKLPNPPVPEIEAANILKLSFLDWFREWWPAQTLRWQMILILNIVPLVLLPIYFFRRQYDLAVICLIIIVNVLFWFFRAPDPRFAYGFLFFGLAISLSIPLALMFRFAPVGKVMVVAVPVALLLVMYTKSDVDFTKNMKASLFLIPNEMETIETEVFVAHNVQVHIPRNGKLLCFNTPLPCTPYPNSGLMLRGRDLQSGFRVIPGYLPQISRE